MKFLNDVFWGIVIGIITILGIMALVAFYGSALACTPARAEGTTPVTAAATTVASTAGIAGVVAAQPTVDPTTTWLVVSQMTVELTAPTADPTEEPTDPTETPKPTAAPNPYGFVDDHGDVPMEVLILAMDDNPWRSKTVVVSERDDNKILQAWKAGKLYAEVQIPQEFGQGGFISVYSIGEETEIKENISDTEYIYLYQRGNFSLCVQAYSSDSPKEGILVFGTKTGLAIVFDKTRCKSWEYQFQEKKPVEARGGHFVQDTLVIGYKEVMNG